MGLKRSLYNRRNWEQWLVLAVLAPMLPGACTPKADDPQGPETHLPSGIRGSELESDIRTLRSTRMPEGMRIHITGQPEHELLLAELDPALFEPVLIADTKQGISAETALTANDLQLVIGSGFVAELHSLQPVGLLQVEGNTLNPLQGHGYTRILGINDQGMGVVHREAYQRDLFHSALQAGPGIIEQGQLDISEHDLQRPKYFRSFVAICEKRWLSGISLAPTHLRTLGQTLVDFFREQKWQCNDVVNLAGDREAVTLLRSADGQVYFHGDPTTHKASLLGFRKR